MDEIAIVKRRTPVAAIIALLLVLALVVLAVLWMLGYLQLPELDLSGAVIPLPVVPGAVVGTAG